MASRRMISSSIFENDFFGGLTLFQRLLWIGLFTACADDQGRLSDNLLVIRAKIFPYDDVDPNEIESALALFEASGKILRYVVGDKRLIQIPSWWANQRPQWAQPSNYPPPEGWVDGIRTRQNGEYFERDWASKGFSSDGPLPDSSGEGSPETTSRTVRLVEQYPVPVPVPVPDLVPGEQISAREGKTEESDLFARKQPENGEGEDRFDLLQRACEEVIGLPITQGDVAPIQGMAAIGATRADIQAAADWMAANGKTIRYVGQLFGPVRTAVAKRKQAALGRDGPPGAKKNGRDRLYSGVDSDSPEFRDRYRLPADLQPD